MIVLLAGMVMESLPQGTTQARIRQRALARLKALTRLRSRGPVRSKGMMPKQAQVFQRQQKSLHALPHVTKTPHMHIAPNMPTKPPPPLNLSKVPQSVAGLKKPPLPRRALERLKSFLRRAKKPLIGVGALGAMAGGTAGILGGAAKASKDDDEE